MSISVEIGLLSGKTVSMKADLKEEVGIMNRRAQTALGVGRGRLVDSSGHILDESAPVKRARLQNGDALTLHVTRVTLQACRPLLLPFLAMDRS